MGLEREWPSWQHEKEKNQKSWVDLSKVKF